MLIMEIKRDVVIFVQKGMQAICPRFERIDLVTVLIEGREVSWAIPIQYCYCGFSFVQS